MCEPRRQLDHAGGESAEYRTGDRSLPRGGHDFGRIPVFPISAPEAPTRDADGVTTETQGPAPAPGVFPPSPPPPSAADHCRTTGSFSGIPSGVLAATMTGSKLGTTFDMTADFDSAIPCDCSRGEYRQYVRGTFTANGAPVTHHIGPGVTMDPTTFRTRRKRDHGELFRSARLSHDLLAFRARSGWRVPIPGTGYSGDFGRIGNSPDRQLGFSGQAHRHGRWQSSAGIRFVECSRQRHGALAKGHKGRSHVLRAPGGCHGFHRRERSARHGHRRDGTGAGLLQRWLACHRADRAAEWIRADHGRRDRRSACRPAGT